MKKHLYCLYMMGKFSLYGLVLQIFFINLLYAGNSNAQGTKDISEIMVTVDFENASLEETFATLSNLTELSFVFEKKFINEQARVNLNVQNQSLEQVLLSLSASHDLAFQQVNDRISVKNRDANHNKAMEEEEVVVSGRVTDESGEPLPGATIAVEGSSKGTVTDSEGNYQLEVPDGSTLTFSFIGFKKQSIQVGNQTVIDVVLSFDDTSLEEVIVVGYGEMRKAHLTGAVESIDAGELENLPTGNLGTALAGRVLGVGVSGGNTRPGGAANLTIRNPISLSKDGGNNTPLFVIDGIIQVGGDGSNDATQFNNLDPSEVESISFLKDASAAVYGSRGSNGVILVTTKRGKAGVPRISYSGTFGINDEAYRTKMMSAYDFGNYYNIMNGPNGANATPGDENRFFSQDELDHFRNIDYDWLDKAWSTAFNMRHTLNVSGGSEKATYFANVSYYTQNGNLSSLDYDRWNFRAGADMDVANNLKVGLQVGGYYSDLTKTFNKIGNENDENDYKNLLKAPRYVPMYNGEYPVKLPGSTGSKDISNYHFFEIERLANLATNTEQFMTVNIYAQYDIPFIQGLQARISHGRNMGADRGTQIGTSYMLYEFDRLGENRHIYDGAEMTIGREYLNGDRVYFSNRRSLSQQSNFTLNYSREIGQHNVSALVTVEKAEAETSQEDVWKEKPSQGTTGHFGTAFGNIDGKTNFNESGNLSYVGRANWSYSEKYLAEFLFRSDASTKFAPENYWGKFYSGSLGWIISNESFFNSLSINHLKIRYSVGLLGKDDTRPWQWRQRYTFQGGKGAVFGGNEPTSTGMKMEASPNRDATWSNDFKNNLGVDALFLDNRLSTTVELFYNQGTNLLLERTGSVPITVGGSIAAENFGEIDFFGYELAVGWDDQRGDFRYGINTRFSWSDNKVKVGNFNDTDILYPWNAQPNKSTDNGVWGYDYMGMFKNQADIDAYTEQYDIDQVFGVTADQLRPGMLYYRDLRGPLQADGTFAAPDGIIDDNDQVQLAKRASNHYGYGMTLKFGYKSLSFDCVIAGSFGGWSEMDRNKLNNSINNAYESAPVFWNNIYDPDLNPEGVYPNPYHENISLKPLSSFWEVDGFRMRVRSFSLNYSIPNRLANSLNVSNARVYLSGINPLNLYNPFGYKDSEGAFDTYPVLRTFALGINLSL